MIDFKSASIRVGITIALASLTTQVLAQTVLFSDSFDRVVGTPDENGMIDDGMGGMMPNPAAATSWGDNDNAVGGGDISQTYEIGPDIRGGNRHQYVDGDVARFRTGWAEIQHDFAADSRVGAGGGLKIEFDARVADATVGWLALAIGQSEAETTDGGDNNSVFLMVEDTVDFGVLFGGVSGAGVPTPMQIFEGDDFPAAFDPAFSGDWGFGSSPNDEQRFRIEIASDDFAVDGANATANIFVTHPTFGERQVLTNYAFDWDADGEAYIGFSSNKDQGCNPAGCEDPSQEVQIDNLVISTLTTVVLGNGDYNADGLVDAADFTVWRDTFGQTVTPLSGADGDGDGEIGQGDYNLWASRYGDSPGVATSIPEPSALLLASFAGIFAVRCCRR